MSPHGPARFLEKWCLKRPVPVKYRPARRHECGIIDERRGTNGDHPFRLFRSPIQPLGVYLINCKRGLQVDTIFQKISGISENKSGGGPKSAYANRTDIGFARSRTGDSRAARRIMGRRNSARPAAADLVKAAAFGLSKRDRVLRLIPRLFCCQNHRPLSRSQRRLQEVHWK